MKTDSFRSKTVSDMTDAETAAHLREYVKYPGLNNTWSWPTDACGYDQHIRFCDYRNANWKGGTREEWVEFILIYSALLDKQNGPARVWDSRIGKMVDKGK